jgi:hypothetical protein
MPSAPVQLSYSSPIAVDLSGANEVNLVSVTTAGHRVTVNVSATALNAAFKWSRAAGTARPVGAFDVSGQTALASEIKGGLEGTISDLDSTLALNFNTDSNPDPRINALVGADRLVAPYILYKAYGRSVTSTSEELLNAEDLSGMASTTGVANQIAAHLADAGNATAIDKMFQDLLAANPGRFFDGAGNQISGLFETFADKNGNSGATGWKFASGDKVELKLVLEFKSDISVVDGDGAKNKVIASGDRFNLRLQMNLV